MHYTILQNTQNIAFLFQWDKTPNSCLPQFKWQRTWIDSSQKQTAEKKIQKGFKHKRGCSAFFMLIDMPTSPSLNLPTIRKTGKHNMNICEKADSLVITGTNQVNQWEAIWQWLSTSKCHWPFPPLTPFPGIYMLHRCTPISVKKRRKNIYIYSQG